MCRWWISQQCGSWRWRNSGWRRSVGSWWWTVMSIDTWASGGCWYHRVDRMNVRRHGRSRSNNTGTFRRVWRITLLLACESNKKISEINIAARNLPLVMQIKFQKLGNNVETRTIGQQDRKWFFYFALLNSTFQFQHFSPLTSKTHNSIMNVQPDRQAG